MQAVLVGEADRAMRLMRDLRHFAGGLAGADLGRGHGNGERGRAAATALAALSTATDAAAACSATKDRDALLAFYDFPAEHWIVPRS